VGGTPIALAAEHRLPTPCGLPCPSAHRPVASFEGVPSLFLHRSITPPVPGVRALDTAWRLQPAYSLVAQFHAVARFMLVADRFTQPVSVPVAQRQGGGAFVGVAHPPHLREVLCPGSSVESWANMPPRALTGAS
jgi:hypothetical protein